MPIAPSAPLIPSAPPPVPATPLIPSAPLGPEPSSDGVASSGASASSFATAVSLNKRQQKEVVDRQRGKVAHNRATNRRHTNKNTSIVIGKNVNSGVVSWRGADLTVARYIGRVAIGTTAEEIRASLESRGVDVISIEAIKTKHTRFASFKLVIKKSQLEIIEKDDFWPHGVIVGHWWSPKPIDAIEQQQRSS